LISICKIFLVHKKEIYDLILKGEECFLKYELKTQRIQSAGALFFFRSVSCASCDGFLTAFHMTR